MLTSLSYLQLLLGIVILAIPAYVYYAFDRPSLQGLAVAVGRMVIQLSLVGLLLWAVYTVDSPWLTGLWLILMSAVVALGTCRRARLSKRLMLPVAAGTFASVLLMTLYLLLVVLRAVEPLSAKWVVPVAGVLLAHVLTTNISGLSAFYRQLKAGRVEYETLTGNGLSHLKALKPFAGQALRAMAIPAITSLSATGLLALPLLLSGQLLAGLSPVVAVKLTVLFIIACLTTSVLALLLILWLADRLTFDRRGNHVNMTPHDEKMTDREREYTGDAETEKS